MGSVRRCAMAERKCGNCKHRDPDKFVIEGWAHMLMHKADVCTNPASPMCDIHIGVHKQTPACKSWEAE